ncbi:2-oxoacid:acceptor oxidoreductase subunit alpha [Picrophilus oshimae]|uniref:2-oxoglutarate synthase subunit KorA n=1 Tax=Picrophilus torridus (strain ATCC 700027 / DSM 9790 / JCM 10055 / NBRC 100828 / KAW 2/3) TaxID=1122961 RepID=Q6KZA7_PICTO|nr:2-oxoacid:acceptor oxidoreductase subunit alpha [Picrophilus oshimae]AAT43945.1 pyruvate ferredoxin oxidoreductase, alpha chain [Picrophilus oshimae DSM 9789]
MREDEVIIRIGGAAGDGVQSAGEILIRTFSRCGLYVTSYNYYQDLIRGGESWYQVRASDHKVKNQGDGLDLLIALNKDALERHTNPDINEGGASPLEGIAIFDDGIKGYREYKNVSYCPVPMVDIARKYSDNSLLKNTVGLGAAIAAINGDFETFAGVIRDQFGKKGEIAELNVKAAQDGYDYFMSHYKSIKKTYKISKKPKYVIAGGASIALGAVNAGVKMYVAYPMTPASSALHFMAQHAKKFGVFVKMPEDEISAINTIIGANYAGIRAMTGSSGGGFALMTEAVGLAGMTEVPAVIYEAQRPGPSTGLPTKTEQGDLNQVLGASQGDFPRIVLAPRNVEEAFYTVQEAFNLADKYQCPVFVISDLYLSEHYDTVDKLNLDYPIDRGYIVKEAENYKRYEFTENGISPRALPGTPKLMHNEDSDEHDEYGNVVSDAITDPVIRSRMVEKRMRKLEDYKKSIPGTETYKLDDAEYAVILWGSTQGAVEEAIDILRSNGIKIGAIEPTHIYPLNEDIKELVKNKKLVFTVENNYSGQFRRLLRAELLIDSIGINKYNGEAFYPGEIVKEISKFILEEKNIME